MSYKTLLAVLQTETDIERILPTALDLAAQQEAHLIGLHVMPGPLIVPSWGMESVAGLLALAKENAEAHAHRLRKSFDARVAEARSISTEWTVDPSILPETSDEIVARARRVDLVIAAQHDPENHSINASDTPGHLVLQCGRPVLFIPHANAARTLASHAIIGWNGSREAARAVFDALPLLEACERVTLICAQEEADGRTVEGTEIAATLARHGIRVEIDNEQRAGMTAADVLLCRAADLGADLIVTGAYGRSRAREFVFGGVTRDLLRTMTVPTLMSH